MVRLGSTRALAVMVKVTLASALLEENREGGPDAGHAPHLQAAAVLLHEAPRHRLFGRITVVLAVPESRVPDGSKAG
jgi:hypothetical protein